MAILDSAALKALFETGDVPTQSNFEDLIDSTYAGKNQVHADNATVLPAVAGAPTIEELEAFAAAGSHVDVLLYYTGDDLPASAPTYVAAIDQAGNGLMLAQPAQALTLSSAIAPAADDATGAAGASADPARGDHKHPAQAPSGDTSSGANAITTGSDGLHYLGIDSLLADTVSPASTNGTGSLGVSQEMARQDHAHPAQAPSADANNAIVPGADDLHHVPVAQDADITAQTAGKVLDATRILDEDAFTSDSDLHVPTQQSVKAYVSAAIAGGVRYRGALAGNADLTADSTGNAYLDGAAEVLQGDLFKVSSDGVLTTSSGANLEVKVGDNVYFNTGSADAAIADSMIDIIDNTEMQMIGATVAATGGAGNAPAPSAGEDLKLLSGAGTYVDASVIKVLSFVDFVAAEPTQTVGNQHVNIASGASSASAQAVTAGYIYRWDGSAWLETVPVEGQLVDDANDDKVYRWNGTVWAEFGSNKPTYSATVSTGVDITPDFDANQDFVLLFDNTSTGDINFANSSTTNLEHGEKIRVVLTNGDAVARNLVFGSNYVNPDNTAVGTLALAPAPGEYRVLEFVRTGADNVTLISDTFEVPSDVTATLIDSSAAPVVETLPAATGSGAIIYYANANVTSNAATLAVALGESLNGVTDGTFLFSNYPAGTQFRADDVAAGEWVVSVVGASTERLNGARFELTTSDINSVWSISDPADLTFNTSENGQGCVLPFQSTRFSSGWTLASPDSTEWPDGGASNSHSFANRINDTFMTPDESGLYRFTFPAVDAVNTEVNNSSQGSLVSCLAIDGTIVQYIDQNSDGDPQMRVVVQQVNAGQKVQIGLVSANLDAADAFNFVAALNESDTHFSAGADVVHLYVDIEKAQRSEVVLAGMVTPEQLVYAWAYSQNASIVQQNVDVDFALAASKYDPDGVIGTTGFTAPFDGVYEFEVSTSHATSGVAASTIQILIDGTVVATQEARDQGGSGGDWLKNGAAWLGTLTAGQVVSVRETAQAGQVVHISATFKQLPDSTVVMPDAVPVEDLTPVLLLETPAAVSSGATLTLDNGVTWAEVRDTYATVRITLLSSSSQGILRTATFDISNMLMNGTEDLYFGWPETASTYLRDLESSPGECTILLSSGTPRVRIEGIPKQKTVINTTDTPVNDQTTSKYMEIGNKLQQWGSDSATGTTPKTVTFPTPFADNSYAVTVAPTGGGNGQTVTITGKTAAGFTLTSVDINGTPQSPSFDFIAVGLKP